MKALAHEEVFTGRGGVRVVYLNITSGSVALEFQMPSNTWVQDGEVYETSQAVQFVQEAGVKWRSVISGTAEVAILNDNNF